MIGLQIPKKRLVEDGMTAHCLFLPDSDPF
ncbi:hypothetical protein HNO89_003197 [Sporosarcina luteola]|nr:hypothetical protein [Sporosarcina luteola]